MHIYFLIVRIAAFFGHRKARALVQGQRATLAPEQVTKMKSLQGCVWIHAASVGEFEQARPLIEKLREEQPNRRIVLTFFSPSGYEMRKDYELVDAVMYLPFATRKNANLFLEALQPQIAIFVKYEFWPAYLKALKKRGIKTYSISAIFRPTQRFFRWYGKVSLGLLKCFTHIFVQDERSLQLLKTHGIQDASVAGDTRFDRVSKVCRSIAEKRGTDGRLRIIEQFVEGCERVIVAGSTWPKDEELLAQYMEQYPETKLILVPHEIDEEHLHFIFNRFLGRFVRYTRVTPQTMIHANVLVMDQMGLLSSIYGFGHAAYIGGGFGVGIHNTIEAAVYGLPVLFGPNYHHFREAQGLIDAGAARSIKNYSELEAALNTALNQHQEIGAKAAEYVRSELGATEKIYKQIFGN